MTPARSPGSGEEIGAAPLEDLRRGEEIVTEVECGRRWVTECPMPLGKVIFDHLVEPVAGGYVRVVKRVEVEGACGPLVRMFAPKMRRDIAASLVALQGQLSR